VQHVATRFAALEATAYGARFGPSATARGYEAESRVLEANELRSERLDDSARLARRRWRMVPLGSRVGGDAAVSSIGEEGAAAAAANRNVWSRGEEYVRLWREGVRPDYSPALTEPISSTLSKFDMALSADYMGTRSRGPSLRP
jgi:small subunit ribosomal protein S23